MQELLATYPSGMNSLDLLRVCFNGSECGGGAEELPAGVQENSIREKWQTRFFSFFLEGLSDGAEYQEARTWPRTVLSLLRPCFPKLRGSSIEHLFVH